MADPVKVATREGDELATVTDGGWVDLADGSFLAPDESLRLAHAILSRSWVRCEERMPPHTGFFDVGKWQHGMWETRVAYCWDNVNGKWDTVVGEWTHWQERIPPPPKES